MYVYIDDVLWDMGIKLRRNEWPLDNILISHFLPFPSDKEVI